MLLFNINTFATSATLAEVCAQLSAILVASCIALNISLDFLVTGCIAGANIWQSYYLLPVTATAAAARGMGFSLWIYFGISFRCSR